MSQPTTSLARIRAAEPCATSWRLGLHAAGGLRKYGADTPITVRQIVEAMGLDAALWCLRTMPEHSSLWRLFAVSCARRVQHLMTDPRSVAALDVAERRARGEATDKDLSDAGDAAWDAAWDAASDAAWAAAGDAAWDAASAAARDAERAWQAAELIRICEELGA